MKFYLYYHRRPDTGDVFYVGRGRMYKKSAYPRRAYSVDKRNYIWRGIVKRNDGSFSVEVIQWYATPDEVNQAERDAIARFGKIIDGVGTLCNLTDGGEGCEGFRHSVEAIMKMKAAFARDPTRLALLKSPDFIERRTSKLRGKPTWGLGKRMSRGTRAKMSAAHKGAKHYAAKLVINTGTGDVFGCVEDAAKSINLNKWTLYKALSGERANHTTMRYQDGV